MEIQVSIIGPFFWVPFLYFIRYLIREIKYRVKSAASDLKQESAMIFFVNHFETNLGFSIYMCLSFSISELETSNTVFQ